jgi:hypothetical protein
MRGLGSEGGLDMDAITISNMRGFVMAEEEPILTSPPTQDVAVHVRDYTRFTKLLKISAIVCLIIGLFIVFFVLQ